MDIYDSIGQAFRLVDGLWRFADGASDNATASTPDVPVPIARLRLSFSVSLDEEHVELSVSSGGRVLYVGARAHHYLLLTLARQRLKDAVRGVPESEHGWLRTDSWLRDPCMSRERMNIDVFRIRREFSRMPIVGAFRIIERRHVTRELRLAACEISLRPDSRSQAQSLYLRSGRSTKNSSSSATSSRIPPPAQ